MMLIEGYGFFEYLILIVLGFGPWLGGLCLFFWVIAKRDSEDKK